MKYGAFVLLATACLLRNAAAEETGDIEPGTRVRVSTMDVDDRIGLVERVTADSLVIRLEGGDPLPWSVPLVEVTNVEMSQGVRGRCEGAWHKAKWGALFGAVPGAISLGLQHDQVGETGSSVPEAMALGAWSGGLFGGVIGAVIGAIDPGEKWERVTPSFRIHPKEYGGGFSFGATVEF